VEGKSRCFPVQSEIIRPTCGTWEVELAKSLRSHSKRQEVYREIHIALEGGINSSLIKVTY
jgi:hypothetical protein